MGFDPTRYRSERAAKAPANVAQGDWKVTATVWQGDDRAEVLDVHPGYHDGVYGMAVDIGSTTVAAYLCNLRTGELLATESAMNPQVVYGEDLMSRISYAMVHKDGLEQMHTAIVDTLNKLAARASAASASGHAIFTRQCSSATRR